MKQYQDLIKDVLNNGIDSPDRTGTGTLSVFGRQVRYDLSEGFPLVTSKKTYWKGVLIELLWIMSGNTNIDFLKVHNVNIWNEWADSNGDLGPVYGAQWRNWRGVYGDTTDQLSNVISEIKTNPNSRRLIINAWNVGELDDMALPPCHAFIQFYVRNNKLSCQLYQRSADLFLGVPFNIASYACLTHLIANECGLEVGEFVHTFGDLHLYNNHIDLSKQILNNDPLPLPNLEVKIPQGELLQFIDNIQNMTWEEIKQKIVLTNYKSHGTVKGDVAV